MLSFDTDPLTGSEYAFTRLRLAANTSAEAPTLVLPRVEGACCTTAVGMELAGVEDPAEFEAVTATLRVLPTSPLATAYVDAVAPVIGAQPSPAELQRCHWYS